MELSYLFRKYEFFEMRVNSQDVMVEEDENSTI